MWLRGLGPGPLQALRPYIPIGPIVVPFGGGYLLHRILYMNPMNPMNSKKELLWGLWVGLRAERVYGPEKRDQYSWRLG